jgi:UrcA family protein
MATNQYKSRSKIMCNQWNAVQCDNHSTMNARSAKESIVRVMKVVRANAIGMTWAVLASGPLASVADAAPAGGSLPHKVVGFKDLNLGSTEGAAVLYRRIKSAAAEVCGERDRLYLAQQSATQTCIDEAVARAVGEVNNPMLTSLYNAKNGKADKQVATFAQSR